MNKRGFTILELLISIALISVVLLLPLRVMMSLEVIGHDPTYASDDEIPRTEIIKNIESDFLEYHLNGLEIINENSRTIITLDMEEEKEIIIEESRLTYDDEVYPLKSANATYDLCVLYEYQDLENDYYFLRISIPVLIDGEDTTVQDNLEFTYIGLKNELTHYPEAFSC